MFVIALRDIEAGEELTIDYNWPAEAAIRCGCGELDCRGWVVSLDVMDQLSPEQQAIAYGSSEHDSDGEHDHADESVIDI